MITVPTRSAQLTAPTVRRQNDPIRHPLRAGGSAHIVLMYRRDTSRR
jgi:hypothetical protein